MTTDLVPPLTKPTITEGEQADSGGRRRSGSSDDLDHDAPDACRWGVSRKSPPLLQLESRRTVGLAFGARYRQTRNRRNLVTAGLTIVCPIRGVIKARPRSRDGLNPSEELVRVQAIRHFLSLGYPQEHFLIEPVALRFGSSGRNSVRADIAIFDRPASDIDTKSSGGVLDHSLILIEVKRDPAVKKSAKDIQVTPLLDFARREDTVVVAWGEVEQRIYWNEWHGGKRQTREGPLAGAPRFGGKPSIRRLTLGDADPTIPLLGMFSRVEDVLHAAGIGPNKRFVIMFQLLLAKIFDEHEARARQDGALTIQDFASSGASPEDVQRILSDLIARAVRFYSPYLPERVPQRLEAPPECLGEVARIIAPSRITAMNREVIQEFYMYFARHIYKWDLAQYFTPTALTEFIIEVLNPRPSEHLHDPACGSADFLTAAVRRGSEWANYSSNVWGSDVSREAVQVAVLNMILNGDGRSNIVCRDSLENIAKEAARYDAVVCNPPFGARIVERRNQVLKQFDLGHEWGAVDGAGIEMSGSVLEVQETGVLFVEACVRMLRPLGRLAIILPNGYLGNRSTRYSALREWLLRNVRIAAIVALPRFTFKASGADVSASVVFCERRARPLASSEEGDEYDISVEVIDRVGWTTGDSKGSKLYKRDMEDGTFLVDDDGELVPDSEFDQTVQRIRNSFAAEYFPWLRDGVRNSAGDASDIGWTVESGQVLDDKFRTLDPKRYSRKFSETRAQIASAPHMKLGDVVNIVPELQVQGAKVAILSSQVYKYVEIQDVGTGSYSWRERRGWDLPQRARHVAEPGDIFVGGIRNSVRKWFLVEEAAENLVVTNGMRRLRLKEDQARDAIVDLVVGLSSEAYRVQMRGFARGADGLAEIADEDLVEVLLPRIDDPGAVEEINNFVSLLRKGQARIETLVDRLRTSGLVKFQEPPPQPDHTALL